MPRPRGVQRRRRRRSRHELPGSGAMAEGLPWPLAARGQRGERQKERRQNFEQGTASIPSGRGRLPESARRHKQLKLVPQ
jgi:hypothetical protein